MDSATQAERATPPAQGPAQDLAGLEHTIRAIYDEVLVPLAARTGFDLARSREEALGRPTLLFLGNHSSGKSSFINYLVQFNLQKTGLAPTDDGFSLLTYGEKADELDGQTVVTHRDLAYRDLRELGPAFLARLRLKTYPHELLKSVTLIDSPGMIDAAGSANTRGYDFRAAVRSFAERADLILFFFDPDKPGTTGETVSIFTQTLAGLEHKLLIILHKVDLFQNMRDFARTYGTLCWNLAKAIPSKDIPHIYCTFLPGLSRAGAGGEGALPLRDFDASREEVIAEIKRAPTRRRDNLASDLHQTASRLALHARVCHGVARQFRALRRTWLGLAVLAILLGALVAWRTWSRESLAWPLGSVVGGMAAAGLCWLAARWQLQRFAQRLATEPAVADAYFEAIFRKELALRERADLRAAWESVRTQTMGSLKALGPARLPGALTTWRLLKRLERVIDQDVPRFRRQPGEL